MEAKPVFGAELGSNRGVIGYCNENKKHRSQGGDSYINGHYAGIKYQCVEYARRWLIQIKNLTFKSTLCACNIWDIDHLTSTQNNQKIPLVRIPNGSRVAPQIGALLIYKRRLFLPFGHVAVITDVDPNNNFVCIAEQNVDEVYWPGDYARKLELEVVDGQFFVRDKFALYGWMVYENVPVLDEDKGKCEIF